VSKKLENGSKMLLYDNYDDKRIPSTTDFAFGSNRYSTVSSAATHHIPYSTHLDLYSNNNPPSSMAWGSAKPSAST
jgi:hypothetical protein